jgi:subtilisin family serine protease
MNKKRLQISLLIVVFIVVNVAVNAQVKRFGFDKFLKESPNQITTFCVPNDAETRLLLRKEKISEKYSSAHWIFISCTPAWIDAKTHSGELKNFYFEFAPPMALADSAVVRHHALEVHQGSNGLSSSYTGKNVIVGVVDQGLDWSHPDFKLSNGKTRVLRYWDHSMNVGGTVPLPYNYGIVWDSAAINAGICTSTENATAHGTTVTGMAAGNGLANGTNKGFAPESELIIVETNFNLQNWTLSIADACDYIFKVADSLGKPAVINLSLGTYLGSHDGNDPAAEYIEELLTSKNGRIVVCAAGNSGQWGKYHVHGAVDSDTSFVWMLPNPTSQLGANTIFMDLWTDSAQATWNYAFGANKSSGSFSERAVTIFRAANTAIGGVIYDTLWNNGHRIATIEIYPEYIDNNLHIQFYFSNVDSTNYYYALKVTGSGDFDAWTGSTSLQLNNMVSIIPSSSQYPPIFNYLMPDSLQTVVSSWNCSEKVISVGNVKNRISYVDNNGNIYNGFADQVPSGKLSLNSSKGPNRHNVIKPDISATGDVSLSAVPMWMVNNPAYNNNVDSGGYHGRNGGTSMSSPVVAGIAALYLEKCGNASYSAFKNDLINTAFSDQYTGNVPNNAYGHGKPHALNLLLSNEFNATVIGDSGMCSPIPLTVTSSDALSTAYWSNDSVGITVSIASPGDYWAMVYNQTGCFTTSDTFSVVQLEGLPIMPITQIGNTLVTSSFSNYQWTLNGQDIPGANGSTLVISPPYGVYTCYSVSSEGCISETALYTVSSGIEELQNHIFIHPNPAVTTIEIGFNDHEQKLRFFEASGKRISVPKLDETHWDVSLLQSGIYHIEISVGDLIHHSKFIKL